MSQVSGQVGIQTAADGVGTQPFRQARTTELVVTDAHGKYYETVARGNVYSQSVAGGAATAFTGGAAGTPLISIYNPVGSGKNLAILFVGVASRVASTLAGTVGFNLWAGASATNTGTLTTPRNMLTQAQSGSVALSSSNAATTGTSATSLAMPLGSYYWATAAGAIISPAFFDVAGAVVCAPGNLVALGGTAALTTATYDVSMVWEEIAI